MAKPEVITILEKVLGKGTINQNNDQIKFYCPFCHHHKQKLEVCIDENSSGYQNWNCWVCGHNGNRGKTIYSLFRKLNVRGELLHIAKELINTKDKKLITKLENKEDKPLITLPNEFIPLSIPITTKTTPDYKNALHYLKYKRKLTQDDIIRYNIGYCEDGEWAGRIIIPSYDEYNQLNYFIGRAYYEDSDLRAYKNPNLSRDIIGFENMINWNYPIILVEGGFDAIAGKRNTIPLFGKDVLPKLKIKITDNKVKHIYLALDNDALKDMIPLIQYFVGSGINVYIVFLPEKDPAEMGYKKFIKLINSIKSPATFKDIVKLKLL